MTDFSATEERHRIHLKIVWLEHKLDSIREIVSQAHYHAATAQEAEAWILAQLDKEEK